MLNELRAQVKRRHDLLERLRFVSPAIVVQLALEDVAGSGAARHQRFEVQTDGLHDRFQAYFNARIRAGDPLRKADLDGVPQLVFREEPATALVWRVATGVLGLLLGTAALFGLARPGRRRGGRLAG